MNHDLSFLSDDFCEEDVREEDVNFNEWEIMEGIDDYMEVSLGRDNDFRELNFDM
jgi:hypothetical protein